MNDGGQVNRLTFAALPFGARLGRCLKQPEQEFITAPVVIALLPCQYGSAFPAN